VYTLAQEEERLGTDGEEILPLPSHDDNDFARRLLRPPRPAARWVNLLGAVLAGNAIYFLLLYSHLPARWQHQPFVLDLGLGLDFLLCVALYLAARWLLPRV